MIQKRYFALFLGNSMNRRWLNHVLKDKILFPFTLLFVLALYVQFFAGKKTVSMQKGLSCSTQVSQGWTSVSVPGQTRTVRIQTDRQPHSQLKFKTILLWTKYFSEVFSNDFYFFQEGQNTFKQYGCEFSNCLVTSNKSLLPTVDAVLFHARDLNFSDVPKRVNSAQIWILYSMEPPRYMLLRWKIVQSLFNWTMTYRSDSDIQVKYGDVIRSNSSCRSRDLGHRRSSERPKGAIWMVSNCRTESRREAYVKELKKFFSVDVYGKCSRKFKCDPPQSEACYKLLSDYKYYLSFENSICKDYVTEKFFNVLQYDIVPVVYGGADYAGVAPRNSYIDAMQFPSPQRLAEYLKRVADDDPSYDRYFEWKSHYQVHLHPWMCGLCRRLHDQSDQVTAVSSKNFWYWWIPSAKCKRWSRKKGFHALFSRN